MPSPTGIAERFRAFLKPAGDSSGAGLLRRGLAYATSTLGFDADAFVYELTDGVIGDNYPEPDRMLTHAERVVHRYLVKTMCDAPPTSFAPAPTAWTRCSAARRRSRP